MTAPLLEHSPGLRAVAVLEELRRQHSELPAGMRRADIDENGRSDGTTTRERDELGTLKRENKRLRIELGDQPPDLRQAPRPRRPRGTGRAGSDETDRRLMQEERGRGRGPAAQEGRLTTVQDADTRPCARSRGPELPRGPVGPALCRRHHPRASRRSREGIPPWGSTALAWLGPWPSVNATAGSKRGLFPNWCRASIPEPQGAAEVPPHTPIVRAGELNFDLESST